MWSVLMYIRGVDWIVLRRNSSSPQWQTESSWSCTFPSSFPSVWDHQSATISNFQVSWPCTTNGWWGVLGQSCIRIDFVNCWCTGLWRQWSRMVSVSRWRWQFSRFSPGGSWTRTSDCIQSSAFFDKLSVAVSSMYLCFAVRAYTP